MNELILTEENVLDIFRKLADKQHIEQDEQDEIFQRFRELVNYLNDREHLE